MTLVNKKITADELAQRLVNSRKVMQKVDTDNYEKGNIDEALLISKDPVDIEDDMPQIKQPITRTAPPPNADKINQSKLPDAIKRAMIESPIPQITLNDSLDMDVAAKARKLMEQDNSYPKSGKQGSAPSAIPSKVTLNSSELEKKLTPIIENIIRKTLDDIVNTKLNQILAAQQTAGLNENLLIKVGDSIFRGKITGVKSTK